MIRCWRSMTWGWRSMTWGSWGGRGGCLVTTVLVEPQAVVAARFDDDEAGKRGGQRRR